MLKIRIKEAKGEMIVLMERLVRFALTMSELQSLALLLGYSLISVGVLVLVGNPKLFASNFAYLLTHSVYLLKY